MAGSDLALRGRLQRGLMIPAHPLALTPQRRLDERRQRGLTRYYIDAGAGGLAVGVHTTQFEIHRPGIGLLQPVLALAIDTATDWRARGRRPVMIAGVVGRTAQAVREATLARDLGYDAVLLSLAALGRETDRSMLWHARAVAEIMPVIGFYLQPAVGGRALSYQFWREFVAIPEVVAIKVAPFDRYRTFDVMRAVAESGRAADIALYTGNDDHIVLDLVTSWLGSAGTRVTMAGGLLGQWAVHPHAAVAVQRRCRAVARHRTPLPAALVSLAAELTDFNGAVFDAAHHFDGCIPGIHEVLRRQGLLRGTWCLNAQAVLSPGQSAEIDRVLRAYPHLTDGDFVRERVSDWLR